MLLTVTRPIAENDKMLQIVADTEKDDTLTRKPITANPSQIIVEQLAASGVRYVFNNPGSREARFMDALHSHPDVHGILALHEGSVAAMAGGYTQAKLEPAAMVVHLSAGLAQSLGQVINLYEGSLPVVIITFAGDTGSYYDRIGMELDPSFGPTSISAPFTKSSWTVVEPEGLAHAVDRAFRVASTPPVGPVHLAVYDRMLGADEVETTIIEGAGRGVRAGAPDDVDLEELERAMRDANRLLLYVGDGVWKSGAQAHVAAIAERYGAAVCGDFRSMPIEHPLHCGHPYEVVTEPVFDTIVCIGARHVGTGFPEPYTPARLAPRIVAVGSDVRNFKNIQDVDLAILADERKTLERLESLAAHHSPGAFDERRAWARGHAAALREKRLQAARAVEAEPGTVRPWVLLDALDETLEDRGGASVMMEQFALPVASMAARGGPGRNTYVSPAGGSEGYGVGAAVGLKLGDPERRVVGLVGDGSLYYADSGLWTAAHHAVPVLFVVPNNRSYGVVATAFGGADGNMTRTGQYGGVVLEGMDPAKIAEAFGVESMTVTDEAAVREAIEEGLQVVDDERRPFLLDVRLPLGLPQGGRPAPHYRLSA